MTFDLVWKATLFWYTFSSESHGCKYSMQKMHLNKIMFILICIVSESPGCKYLMQKMHRNKKMSFTWNLACVGTIVSYVETFVEYFTCDLSLWTFIIWALIAWMLLNLFCTKTCCYNISLFLTIKALVAGMCLIVI